MKEKSKKEIEEVQEDLKSSAPEADLDNEILVNKDKLDVLTNAKYHNKTIKQKQISTKKSKILMAVFGSIGVLGLAAGGAGLAIGLSKKAPAPIDFCEISFDPTNHGTIEGSAEIVKTKIPSNTKWKDIVRPTPVGIIDESKDIQYHFEKWTKEDGSDINPDEIITHEFKAVAFYSATTLSKYHIHTLEFSAGDKGILQDWDSLTIPYKSDEVYNVKFSTFKYLYNLPHVVPNQDYKFKCWVDQNENEMKDDTPVPEGVMNIKASYEYVEPTQQATITYTPTGATTVKGKTSVAVNLNTKFQDVYKPEVEKEGSYFNGWKDSQGTLITSDTEITADIELFPDFIDYPSYQTITFDIPEGVSYVGSLTSYCPTNQLWSKINKPVVSKDKHHFICWYTEYEGQYFELKDTTKISWDVQAVPYFEPDEVQCRIEYQSENEEYGTLSGKTTDSVASGTLWKNINPPTVVEKSSTHKFSGWYLNGQTELTPETAIKADCKIIAKFNKEPIVIDNLVNVVAYEDSVVKITVPESSAPDIQYSTDGTKWNPISSTTELHIKAFDTLYFKGDNQDTNNTFASTRITITGKAKLYGNIMALIDDGRCKTTKIEKSNYFSGLFLSSTGLIEVSKDFLPAVEVSSSAYSNMFYNCTALTTAPNLPANKISSYCYSDMFYGCSKLIIGPEELPADALQYGCYKEMFKGCSSLLATPKMTIHSTGTECCSRMFEDCSSLKTANMNLLSATVNQDSYSFMFWECSSLIQPPRIEATTLSPYAMYSMFYKCSSLNISENKEKTPFFTCPSNTSANVCVYAMFYGTAGMFSQRTVFNSAPTAGHTYYFE